MSQATMVNRLLSAADTLLESKPRSAAYRRRAVSTAYYAVFHALAKLCVEALAVDAERNSDEYLRIYRALDHGNLRKVFSQSPLNTHPTFKKLGPVIGRLQNERQNADYLPPKQDLFPVDQVRELIGQSRYVVTEISNLQKIDRQILAISLLFKDR